jgi:hypothetical protein
VAKKKVADYPPLKPQLSAGRQNVALSSDEAPGTVSHVNVLHVGSETSLQSPVEAHGS